jgi:hypothetical protein
VDKKIIDRVGFGTRWTQEHFARTFAEREGKHVRNFVLLFGAQRDFTHLGGPKQSNRELVALAKHFFFHCIKRNTRHLGAGFVN